MRQSRLSQLALSSTRSWKGRLMASVWSRHAWSHHFVARTSCTALKLSRDPRSPPQRRAGGRTAAPQSKSGSSLAAGLRPGRRRRPGIAAAWPAEQSAAYRGFPQCRARPGARSLSGLRPDAGCGEAGRMPPDCRQQGDPAPMDDGGRYLDLTSRAEEAGFTSHAVAAIAGRARADRRLASLVVRGSWSQMRPARLHR